MNIKDIEDNEHMTKNNAYKGVQAWMQALLEAGQSNTLGDWWSARTLECITLGIELSVAGKLNTYVDGLDFTKDLFQAAKEGLLTQEDVDYNTNQLLMVRWKFAADFFHLEENEAEQDVPEQTLEEQAVVFTSSIVEAEQVVPVKEAPAKEAPVVVQKPKGGRPPKSK